MYCATVDPGPCKLVVKSMRRAFVFTFVTTSRGHIITVPAGVERTYKKTENRLGNLYLKKKNLTRSTFDGGVLCSHCFQRGSVCRHRFHTNVACPFDASFFFFPHLCGMAMFLQRGGAG